MLNKVKIVFLDLDGTLLDEKNQNGHSISKKNLEAIKEARKKGMHIVISTGRSGIQAEKYLKDINYNYAVTGNGAIILKGKNVIKQEMMSVKNTIQIMDFIKKNKLIIKVDDKREAYGCKSFIQRWMTKKINFNPINNFDLDLQKEYYKFVIWGKSKFQMKKMSRKLSSTIKDVSIVSSTGGWTLEVTNNKATKGKANLFVAKEYGITSKKEMLHIGDSMNDSTCIGKMNVVALKNSTKDFYNMSPYHGPSYKNAGVSKVLNGNYTVNKLLDIKK